ncbi:Integral membrane protein-like protein [Candidatus Sulfopaludibacter sp. SbA3]|nr:Integral membrane protein-like protein [Candidatus Sulfopaludibacter sp. SbA3]
MFLYALTILVSAFLLFQVEPVIAKIILPWFGGSAAVWTTCLLFFQLALLMGYLYAHALVRYLKPRMQAVAHIGLLLVSTLALPIYPSASLKPSGAGDPVLGILGLLTLTVGFPFFLLSTTGPLLQAWYARTHKGAMPYRLYALSNAGSMFALLSYPVLFEPVFGTKRQASIWSICYAVFIILCAITAYLAGKAPDAAHEEEEAIATEPPGPALYALWIALPAVASALLLAITNHLSQNVAAIPFLWILPLSLYLLSFILCFEGSGWYKRFPYIPLLAVAVGSMAYALGVDNTGNLNIKVLVPLFSLGLFTCCMVCHGELARLKPHPRYLTHFFVMISVGGALGGLTVGLIAPYVFNAFYELPVGLVVCAILTVIVLKYDKELSWFRNWQQPAFLGAVVLTGALTVYTGMELRNFQKGARLMVRNFYGALKVKDSGPKTDLEATRSLTHGTINHGEQYLNPIRRDLPTTYYGPNTGIGIAIRDKNKSHAVRIGVIGLGTGTIAAYGRLGDYVRYYEINPIVRRIAHSQFSFLDDCRCQTGVAMGDARLSLEKEAPENFDVLAVDAFSSDSIPVHLLTREAMDLYFRHLKPDGILAVHISNRYLDLQPVVRGEAQATGHVARLVDTDDDDSQDVFGATWILVTAPSPGFDGEILNNSAEIASKRTVRLWTDDYSNLFQILK